MTIPAAPGRKPAGNGWWTCTNHEPWTWVSHYVLHERPAEAQSSFVFLVGGAGPRRCDPLSYQAVARGFARRLDRLGIRTPQKTPHACATPMRRRCGRPGCGSWRCSADSGMPRRSRCGSTLGSAAQGLACRLLSAKVVMALRKRLLQAHRKCTARYLPDSLVTGLRPARAATASGRS